MSDDCACTVCAQYVTYMNDIYICVSVRERHGRESAYFTPRAFNYLLNETGQINRLTL